MADDADAAVPSKPFKAEYAKSGRAACKKCKGNIAKDSLRIAKMVQSSKFDGAMAMWFHLRCLLSKPGVIKSMGDVEGLDELRWDDQQELRGLVEAGGSASGTAGTPSPAKAAKGAKGASKAKAAANTDTAAGNGGGGGGDGGDFQMEYAKSNRSTCRGCSEKIDKGEVRIAKMESGSQGFPVPAWRHAKCMLDMGWWTQPLSDMPGWEGIRLEDREALKKGGAPPGATGTPGKGGKEHEEGGEEKKTGARKRKAKEEEEVKEGEDAKGKRKAKGNKKVPAKAVKVEPQKEGAPPKRERAGKEGKDAPKAQQEGKADSTAQEAPGRSQSLRSSKGEPAQEVAGKPGKVGAGPSNGAPGASGSGSGGLMEFQSRRLWDIKDKLKAHCSASDLKQMLTLNGQDASGSEDALRDRLADAVLFGPLPLCPLCNSNIECRDGAYRCRGFLSAWSQCHYKTREDVKRSKAESWKLPDYDSSTTGILAFAQWLKTERPKLGKQFKDGALPLTRLLPPEVAPTAQRPSQSSRALDPSRAEERRGRRQAEEELLPQEGRAKAKPLEGLNFCLMGKLSMSQVAWKEKIEKAGGTLLPDITAEVDCLVTSEMAADRAGGKLKQARSLGVSVVNEAYLKDCTGNGRRMPMSSYAVTSSSGLTEVEEMALQGKRKVKVKGRAAVHEDSGLEESCHVLDEGGRVFSTTLNRADLVAGINSFYVMQLLEDDKMKDWHLFRKWGRVGNKKIGDQKIESLPKDEAVELFCKLFLEKTGNTWESWQTKKGFAKQPGKFYPLEIDYGVDSGGSQLPQLTGAKSRLPRRLVDLLLMLFDVKAYQAALLEFEINTAEMPLGKLTKRHVEQGFQVLTDIQNAIEMPADETGRKEGALVDACNRFFTLIPAVHPRVIRTLEALQTKIRMLESLRDIEIASSILSSSDKQQEQGKEGASDPLDSYYQQLNCDLEPLDKESEDYSLVKFFLENTHAPTHKEWDLELQDVFRVRRPPEQAGFRGDVEQHQLLWHGSRTSNFVGILSQGLRIAPPEAPATGYMFGKGVYFADLVSKSAQYCYPQRDSPSGLMLLSRVALGKSLELKEAQYVEKLPRGKQSTKGLGKMKPDEAQKRVWADSVTVPCGRPVPSAVRNTALNYNEYIVYDTRQVRLEFLLKVKFVHKR